jgi:cell wall-associated NlpC family hydrolase
MSRLCVLCLLVLVPVVRALVPAAVGGQVHPQTTWSASLVARSRIEWRRPRLRPAPLGARAVQIALGVVGTPYRWAGSSRSGFDCSGLVMWSYARLGVHLPHNAAAQSSVGRRVRRGDLQPGDLLFFSGYGHVGLYVGEGRMVHAPQTGERVRVERLAGRYGRRLVEVRRLHA